MPRQISKGTCAFCHRELSKSGMARHLESCEKRIAIQENRDGKHKARKVKAFHIQVEGNWLSMYWMHLEVSQGITLDALDSFLRSIWLECCGHLSAFEIAGVQYSVNEASYAWETRHKNMDVRLDKAFKVGQRNSYEYDFGSTTELVIKVLSEEEVDMQGKSILIMARNTPPFIPCDNCGQATAYLCRECMYEGKGYFCNACAQKHERHKQALKAVVNSPREGVCGYTGPSSSFKVEMFSPVTPG